MVLLNKAVVRAIRELAMARGPAVRRVFHAVRVRSMNLDDPAVRMGIRHPLNQPINILSTLQQAECSEIVVKTPILHHENHDRIDAVPNQSIAQLRDLFGSLSLAAGTSGQKRGQCGRTESL
jgi:hypothetical protein